MENERTPRHEGKTTEAVGGEVEHLAIGGYSNESAARQADPVGTVIQRTPLDLRWPPCERLIVRSRSRRVKGASGAGGIGSSADCIYLGPEALVTQPPAIPHKRLLYEAPELAHHLHASPPGATRWLPGCSFRSLRQSAPS